MAPVNGQLDFDRQHIERIVRTVVNRLRAAQAEGSQSADATPRTSSTAEITIDDRVITIETLANLAGATSVNIGQKAILTPAAKDLLRERGISLQRVSTSSGRGLSTAAKPANVIGLVSFACETALETNSLVEQLARAGVSAECLNSAAGGVAELIPQLATNASRQKLICFTSQPSLVLCAANRHATLRAAGANCACCVREAAGSIGANLLVVKPRGKSQHQLVQLIREFAQCDAACSPEITRLLGSH